MVEDTRVPAHLLRSRPKACQSHVEIAFAILLTICNRERRKSSTFVDLLLTLYSRLELLKDVFLDVPVRHIETVLAKHKTLFQAYGIIAEQLSNYQVARGRAFDKIVKARRHRGIEAALIGRGSAIPKELHAAKKKCERESGKCLDLANSLVSFLN